MDNFRQTFIRLFWNSLGGGTLGGIYFLVTGNLLHGFFVWIVTFAAWGWISCYKLDTTIQRIRNYQAELIHNFNGFLNGIVLHGSPLMELELIYFIGLIPQQDKRIRRYLFHSSADSIKYLKDLSFGASGDKVPGYESLERLGFRIIEPPKGVHYVPVIERKGKIKLHLCLKAPSPKTTEQRILLSSKWRGDWTPLRKSGKDFDCDYELKASITNHLKITIVAPKGISDIELEPTGDLSHMDQEVKDSSDRFRGLIAKTWIINNPSQQTYSYTVKSGQLKSSFRRSWLLLRDIRNLISGQEFPTPNFDE